MKIEAIRLLPLRGATPDGGWDDKFLNEDNNLHTLIEVITDEGVTGLGSVFTSAILIEGAINVLRPFLIGASALDPAATSERLHQQSFWQGRGGAITHAISGIDIALWDILVYAVINNITKGLSRIHYSATVVNYENRTEHRIKRRRKRPSGKAQSRPPRFGPIG